MNLYMFLFIYSIENEDLGDLLIEKEVITKQTLEHSIKKMM